MSPLDLTSRFPPFFQGPVASPPPSPTTKLDALFRTYTPPPLAPSDSVNPTHPRPLLEERVKPIHPYPPILDSGTVESDFYLQNVKPIDLLDKSKLTQFIENWSRKIKKGFEIHAPCVHYSNSKNWMKGSFCLLANPLNRSCITPDFIHCLQEGFNQLARTFEILSNRQVPHEIDYFAKIFEESLRKSSESPEEVDLHSTDFKTEFKSITIKKELKERRKKLKLTIKSDFKKINLVEPELDTVLDWQKQYNELAGEIIDWEENRNRWKVQYFKEAFRAELSKLPADFREKLALEPLPTSFRKLEKKLRVKKPLSQYE